MFTAAFLHLFVSLFVSGLVFRESHQLNQKVREGWDREGGHGDHGSLTLKYPSDGPSFIYDAN